MYTFVHIGRGGRFLRSTLWCVQLFILVYTDWQQRGSGNGYKYICGCTTTASRAHASFMAPFQTEVSVCSYNNLEKFYAVHGIQCVCTHYGCGHLPSSNLSKHYTAAKVHIEDLNFTLGWQITNSYCIFNSWVHTEKVLRIGIDSVKGLGLSNPD